MINLTLHRLLNRDTLNNRGWGNYLPFLDFEHMYVDIIQPHKPKNNPKEYFMARPWFEREILNLAKEAVVNETLGVDSSPDLLFIGFSAMDWMIHDYGPFSQEIMDAFIKLDKYLGYFIKFLDKNTPSLIAS